VERETQKKRSEGERARGRRDQENVCGEGDIGMIVLEWNAGQRWNQIIN
jgi:hypothetical protein